MFIGLLNSFSLSCEDGEANFTYDESDARKFEEFQNVVEQSSQSKYFVKSERK